MEMLRSSNKDVLWRHLVAEFFGTLTLVFLGCSTASAGAGHLTIAVSFGIGLCVAAAIFGGSSSLGGHFNPSVTMTFYLFRVRKDFHLYMFISTCLAQIAGGLTGAGMVMSIYGSKISSALTIPSTTYGWHSILLAEMWGTLFLALFVVFYRKALGPLHSGVCLTGLMLAFGVTSGGAFNPARAFATACVTTNFTGFHLYILGQTIGAIAAVLIAFLLGRNGIRVPKQTVDKKRRNYEMAPNIDRDILDASPLEL